MDKNSATLTAHSQSAPIDSVTVQFLGLEEHKDTGLANCNRICTPHGASHHPPQGGEIAHRNWSDSQLPQQWFF